MLTLTNIGQIRLTRGDTFLLPVSINQGTNMDYVEYTLEPQDELYFGLMEPNQPWEHAILKKKYTGLDLDENKKISIQFSAQDTMCLLPGLYYYQIKVRIYDEDTNQFTVNTIVPKTHFWIEE